MGWQDRAKDMQLEQDDLFGGRDDEDLVATLIALEEIEMQKSMLGAAVDQDKVTPEGDGYEMTPLSRHLVG